MSFVDRNDGPIGNLAELDEWDILLESDRDPKAIYDLIVAQNLDIQKILWQLKHRHLDLRIQTATSNRIAYQTLVTSATNLSTGEMNGTTKANSVLTTQSVTADEFDWREGKRTPRVVVGPGDGVEPHFFMVSPDARFSGGVWGKDAGGNEVQRPGLIMPYGRGTTLQLIFFEFDTADRYLPKPMTMGIGTTIYLEQRLPGE